MAQIYDSSHSGQEIDAAVDAVQTIIPSQLTQIGLKLGDLTQLETTANEDLVSAINEVNEKAEQGGGASLPDTEENGFFLVDSAHYVGMKYDEYGLDAAKLSTHFKELIQSDLRQEVMNLKQPAVTGDTANIVSIGLLSDIHADAVNLEAFIECCKGYNIDYMLHLGDATYEYNYGKASSYSFWTGVEGNDEIMNIVGNHDSRRSGSWTGVPQTEVYDCIINPFISEVTVVQPEDAETNGLCYYYKDLNTHVRLICLDCMFWNQDEYDWLSDVLDDAKTNNMHVIIACHYPTNAITLAESSWNCRLKGAKITDTSIGGQPSYLDKYTPTMASDLVQSFIDGGGKFIAWICGHQHRNWLGHLTAHPTQLQFCVPSSRWDYSKPTYFCELGSINQHCFTIIGIDTKNGYLKAVRIGKRNDSFMQKQQQFCYDYINNALIYTA